MSAFDLTDQVAIVTGGGSGIGEAISKAYAAGGAHVVVAARKLERLERVAGEIRDMGRESLAVATDVTDPAQVKNLIQATLDRFGRLDIMVANSGGGGFPPITEATLEDWDKQIGLNLDSAFLCDVAAGKAMIEQGTGGKIINISSTAGINLNPGLAAYAAAKAGMINLTKTLAVLWAGHDINVNCIAPGFTATEGIRKAGVVPPDTRADGSSVPPLLMPNEPEHVADAAVFLASPASAHVTGELMIVRGMFHMERSDDVLRDRAGLIR
jgi:NAD(P)-dependent dehydrogenase (short-subunit alcohol dehydrogenase family)